MRTTYVKEQTHKFRNLMDKNKIAKRKMKTVSDKKKNSSIKI